MSSIVMVGLSHRDAPLAVLERLAARRSGLDAAALAAGATEAVVLSTCCRTELYAVYPEPEGSWGPAAGQCEFTASWAGLLLDTLIGHDVLNGSARPRARVLTGEAVAVHLFRVAGGLDSRLPGEVDIQGQVRQAAAEAARQDVLGPQLERLFATATATARRIHRETALGALGRSLGRRAAEVGLAAVGSDDPSVVVVGSGRMAARVMERLTEAGVTATVCGRSPSRTARLAGDPARALPLEALPAALVAADLVVCTTSATEALIGPADLLGALNRRRGRPLTVVDLSVPRNVDEAVATLPGVRLIDLEGLGDNPGGCDELRRALEEAEAIAAEEATRYGTERRARRAGPLIAAIRARVEGLCREELTRVAGDGLDPAALERAAAAIAGKLLHAPTLFAREAAAAGDAAALGYLGRILLPRTGVDDVPRAPRRQASDTPSKASEPVTSWRTRPA